VLIKPLTLIGQPINAHCGVLAMWQDKS